MRDVNGDEFAGVDGGSLLIEEQGSFAIGDGAEIFHGTGFEVGNGDQVELFEWVGNTEVGVVVVQSKFCEVDAEGSECDFVGCGAGTDGHSILFTGGALEVAD